MFDIKDIVVNALEFVEITYNKELSGDEKKTKAIKIIEEHINDLPDDEIKKIYSSSLSVISNLIDVIILSSKNKLRLNKKISKICCL